MDDRFRWFRRLDGFGEECLDLTTCTRYRCREIGEFSDRTLIFYQDKNSRWFKCLGTEDPFRNSSGEWDSVYRETFEEAHREEVAHELLQVPWFRGRLTPDLDEYREYGDHAKYAQWFVKTPRADGREWPRWDSRERTFYCGATRYKVLATQAKNQCLVMEALESAKWQQSGVTVKLHHETLLETLKEMGKWLVDTPIYLYRNGDQIGWAWR
jgi:hypothetical protein